jgi:quercetin dioxygenase-like cupin family protein
MRPNALARLVLLGFALAAGGARAQSVLVDEPSPLAPDLKVRMASVDLPPTAGPLTTVGRPGHRHPGSTYVYVLQGAVVSRLGDQPEKRYETGQAWAEKPGQAHYIVSASASVGARLLVVFVSPAAAANLTEPLPHP